MNGITRKKLNLLVHLACVDGNFHYSEKQMIEKIAEERGMTLETVLASDNPLDGIEHISDKEEILYLALQLVRADSVITEEELAFCRKLAKKLAFEETVVDKLVHHPLPSLENFRKLLH